MADRCLRLLPILVCLALVILTTCGKDSPTKPKPPEPPPPVTPVATRIEITPSSAKLNSQGQTVQLTARVFDQNNNAMAGATVTWFSSDVSVAGVNTQGLVTAVKNGTTVITARSGNASATANVTVSQSAGSIVIAPMEATLMSIGATVQLEATVLDGNGQPVEGAVVTWHSSEESVATVSVQGLVMAVGNGVARITATSGSVSSGIDVSVMQSAGSIVIVPMEVTLMSLGATVHLRATVLDGNGQPIAGAVVIWQSGDESVATVSAQGLVTAVKNGVARITTTSGGATAGIDVSVMQSASSIVIEPQMATIMSIGATVQLEATVLDGNGQPVEGAVVTWHSSEESVATVSVQGLVMAVRNGVTRIWATSGSAMSSIAVKVMQSAGSIVIAPMEATLMSLGATVQLTATVLDGNSQPIDGAVVTWQSSDEAVATVNAQGLVTAVSNGVARITATSGGATAGIDITVMQSAGSIVIAPDIATLMSLGATVQLTATVLDQNGQSVEDAVVTWQSGDKAVATVSAQGLVTAVMNGTARVMATSGAATSGIDVTVMQIAGSVVIAPLEATLMSLGATVQLSATVLDANGQHIENAVVTWRSSDESVATVNGQGLVTAVGNGVTRIWAALGSAMSSIAVTVQLPVPSPDRDVLVALYNAMDGPNWKNNTNWLTERHVDEWYGVNTDEEGRVTGLNLGGNNLKGILTTELAQLSQLEGLSLEDNQLTGAIPSELGDFADLSLLYLFGNQLSGVIPPELGQLENLIHLCLNSNRLSGVIPPELGQLSNLKWLHLHNNANLMGALPVELVALDLDALLLQGTQVCLTDDTDLERWLSEISDAPVLPECEGFDRVRIALEALYDATDGPNWGNNQNWKSEVPFGQWHGVETESDGRVVSISLPRNSLSGSIPPEIGWLVHLTLLDLQNNAISGTIPAELGQLNNLRMLNLGRNKLSGNIPRELGHLPNLSGLVLQYNTLSGNIPIETGQFPNLHTLNLRNNRLSGGIPPELGSLNNLKELWLQFNPLSGSIPPELGSLTNLRSLVLIQTGLVESIPREIGKLTNLRDLSLQFNQLTGSIPSELGQLTNLVLLYLGPNQLTGSIPSELGQLSNLETLYFRTNQLSGAVPPELGRLTKMDYLDLGLNPLLVGPLPVEITGMKKIRILNLFRTQLCVPDNAAFQEWVGGLGEHITFVYFDICNPDREALAALYHSTRGDNWQDASEWLSGSSPNTWFGVTTNAEGRVEGLDLEDNNLKGPLPSELGSMIDLRRLILNGNPMLVGQLPRELMNLTIETLQVDETGLCAPVDNDFQSWLMSISQKSVIVNCQEVLDNRSVLTMLYSNTDGPNWLNNTNWLSQRPLGEWFGVTTDNAGRVTKLALERNGIRGQLPRELGLIAELTQLSFTGNELTGSIPAELGQLTKLTSLELTGNGLSGSIPSELGKLENLVRLDLYINQLTGSIPSELGRLARLEKLRLNGNQLTGSIPPELSQMTNLRDIWLGRNSLSGSIPFELSRLTNLHLISLDQNELTGSIPSELGRMPRLRELHLVSNKLSGSIPPELGQPSNQLTVLDLRGNELTGSIPPELGQLPDLLRLLLSNNDLTGQIPPELGQLTRRLSDLDLEFNRLSGSIPDELGDLANLKSLRLTNNPGLIGPIPASLTRLGLETLTFAGTQICIPMDAEIRQWFQGIETRETRSSVTICHSPMNVEAYFTQTVQSFKRPVPLVENEPALLRVFFSTSEAVLNRPAVRATFYQDGAKLDSVFIPAGAFKIPAEIYEGSLDESANALVPAEVIRSGLELVIEIDPDGKVDRISGITERLPETGKLKSNVRSVPPLNLTMVPFLWREDPDYSVVDRTEGITAEDDLFRFTRDLLPVAEFSFFVHEPVWTSVDPVFANRFSLLSETYAIRVMEGKGGHYMGILRHSGGTAGQTTFVSGLFSDIIAHELGHLMNLLHAPCEASVALDPEFPYSDGSIGAWGYNLKNNELIDPNTPDIMGYCRGREGISDYNFNKAIDFRLNEEEDIFRIQASSNGLRSLLIWGGINQSGEIDLAPAFVVDAAPSLPQGTGPYRLVGFDAEGSSLFTLDFAIDEISDSDGGGVFAFAVPVRPSWSDRLSRITFSGPEGTAEVTRDGNRTAALLLDRSTGEVRGILRDWPEEGISTASARRVVPEPGLDVIVSPGIPDPSDW